MRMDPLAVCVYGADKSPAPSRYDTIRMEIIITVYRTFTKLAQKQHIIVDLRVTV